MKSFFTGLFLVLFSNQALGAVGCDLNNPDRDVKRFFPKSTGYKTSYEAIDRLGGEELLKNIETRLGDKFTGLFETIDVPYTVYTIYQNDAIIGYIHGVNQRGTYGGMQVFLMLDVNGNIKDFYFQRLTSKQSKELKSKEFLNQFKGLNLNDFTDYDVSSGIHKKVKNPKEEAKEDFKAALRGVKKNLILLDSFVFNRWEK